MRSSEDVRNNRSYIPMIVMVVIIMLQVIAAFYFCTRKQGFHYDEYYSYYSSNVSEGLAPPDCKWMDSDSILDEFRVRKGEGFNYGMVRLMQTYDVHPPIYYFVLHTVCSLTPGVFSKWQGLAVNLVFFVLAVIVLWMISDIVSDGDRKIGIFTVALFGFSPAIVSGVLFIRMYVMLTFMCQLYLYIHLRALKKESFDVKRFYIPVFILTFITAGIHYYAIVFMFFVALYMFLHLLFDPDTRKKAFIYALSVVLGLMAFLITYPAAVSHILHSYRGTEARAAFFDVQNMVDRAGLFVGILNEYLLHDTYYILILVVLLVYATGRYKKVTGRAMGDRRDYMMRLICVTMFGYFFVVYKTALTNAEEAVRYEMPVYGLIIFFIVYVILLQRDSTKGKADATAVTNSFGEELSPGFFEKMMNAAKVTLLSAAVVLQIVALYQAKVVFLYEQGRASCEWAKEHRDDTIVYIYNPNNQWMIWDDSLELMQYDRIFFVNMDGEDKIEDNDVTEASHMYIYTVRGDRAMDRMDDIIKANESVHSAEKVRELQYVDIYEIR